MDVKHSNSVCVIKGVYKGYLGEFKNVCNKKYIIGIESRNIPFDVDTVFFMDIRYESNEKSGYIQIISTKNDIIDGYFKNDIGKFPIERISLNANDKNIKKNFVNTFVELKYNNDESYVNEVSDEITYVNSYNDFNHVEIDESEFTANDKSIYVKIKNIMDILLVNINNINIYKVINNYNYVIHVIKEKSIIDKNFINLDNDIILYNIIVFELMKAIDVLELYIQYDGVNGFQKYFNMIKNKFIKRVNNYDLLLSKFNVENLLKNLKVQFMKPHKDKLYEICFNVFKYIKYVMPVYSGCLMPFELSEREMYIPLGKFNENKFYFETSTCISDVMREEILESIEELKSKIKIAEANNNVDMLNGLHKKLKEISKKIKKTVNTKKMYPCHTFEDCFYSSLNDLNIKLNKFTKNKDSNNIMMYKYIIDNFADVNCNDVCVNKYREILKNNYFSICSNMSNMEYDKHFNKCMIDISRQINIEKMKYNRNNDRNLLVQMKTMKLNKNSSNDMDVCTSDNDNDNDTSSLFGDVNDINNDEFDE